MAADSPTPAAPVRTAGRIVAVAAVAAAVIVIYGTATRFVDAKRLRDRTADAAVAAVSVVTPTPAPTSAPLELPGRIEAFAQAPIHARVSGYLKGWYADIGKDVRAGELLAVIETPDLDQQLLQADAELANAEANEALAETTAKRWQSLLATDSVSQQEVEEKSADLTAKRAEVKALQANVDRYRTLKQFARITAPFDGIVIRRSTDVGALINVGSAQGPELFVVADLSRLRVYVNVPQNYTAEIRPGTKAVVTVPERPGKQYAAAVQSVANAIDPASGSMLVQLTAANADSELLPGAFARVEFEMPSAAGALSIPASALMFNKSGLQVAVLGPDDRVGLRKVVLSRDLGSTVELSDGIAPTDRVIENPPDGVADGDVVRIASAADRPVAAGPGSQDGHGAH